MSRDRVDCLHCVYSERKTEATRRCRFNPPMTGSWPVVKNEDWCAQFSEGENDTQNEQGRETEKGSDSGSQQPKSL